MYLRLLVFTAMVSLWPAYHATGAPTFYNNRANWEAATGYNFTNIGFYELGLPEKTPITTQYSYLGITFTDPSPNFLLENPIFHDGWGLDGNLWGTIEMAFSQPMYWIGADMAEAKIQLYYQGALIYTSPFDPFSNPFAGVISDQPFDFVRFSSWQYHGTIVIDDLSFGPPIPGPGALGLIALAAACVRRRRRNA